MDTSLTTDTIMGVQPTLISKYLIHGSLPENQCAQVCTPGILCDYSNKGNTDLESSLFGLDRIITKQEPPQNMVPKTFNNIKSPQIDNKLATCFQPFEPVGSRTKRSCNVLSGIEIDRFENPIHKPQEIERIIISEPFRGGFQSRINSKDCNVVECGETLKLKPTYGTRCIQ